MKGIILTILALSLSIGLMAQYSCKEVQYTDNPNGDSPYKDQIISVQGIVTAINRGTGFYIGDADGAPGADFTFFTATPVIWLN
jgi:hypothetical protein